MEALVDRREAARLLGVSLSMVKKLARTKQLPVYHVGRAARFRPSDLERVAGIEPGD